MVPTLNFKKDDLNVGSVSLIVYDIVIISAEDL